MEENKTENKAELKKDYSKSMIYKIEPINVPENEVVEVYIGSTSSMALSSRMAIHRFHYRMHQEGRGHFISAFKLFDKYGVENCQIKLVEMFPCNSGKELREREGYYIAKTPCVNDHVAGRDWKQCTQIIKTFGPAKPKREANEPIPKEKKKEYNKVYYERRKERTVDGVLHPRQCVKAKNDPELMKVKKREYMQRYLDKRKQRLAMAIQAKKEAEALEEHKLKMLEFFKNL